MCLYIYINCRLSLLLVTFMLFLLADKQTLNSNSKQAFVYPH